MTTKIIAIAAFMMGTVSIALAQDAAPNSSPKGASNSDFCWDVSTNQVRPHNSVATSSDVGSGPSSSAGSNSTASSSESGTVGSTGTGEPRMGTGAARPAGMPSC
jgi:hypothetical protein